MRTIIKCNLLHAGIFCLFMFTFGACESFVDLTPPTIARQDQYYKSQTDFTAAVNGIYGGLRGYYGGFYYVSELPSDNLQTNPFGAGNMPIDALTWMPDNGTVTGSWQSAYSIIARANTVLDRIE
ncbi:MAG: RagB/SusD family nutrient uptake outer membrane protein, partial [Tannerella sp.]|nr:RagB/SusD family nutrient uptake outer membrane protein [Tannerella sp.]